MGKIKNPPSFSGIRSESKPLNAPNQQSTISWIWIKWRKKQKQPTSSRSFSLLRVGFPGNRAVGQEFLLGFRLNSSPETKKHPKRRNVACGFCRTNGFSHILVHVTYFQEFSRYAFFTIFFLVILKPPPSSSSLIYLEPGVDRDQIYSQLRARFQIYRELEDQGTLQIGLQMWVDYVSITKKNMTSW